MTMVEVVVSWPSSVEGLLFVSSSASAATCLIRVLPSSSGLKNPVASRPAAKAGGVTGCARKGEICSGEWLVTPRLPLLLLHEVSSGFSSRAVETTSPSRVRRFSSEKDLMFGELGLAAAVAVFGLWCFLAVLPCLRGVPDFFLAGGICLVLVEGDEVGTERLSLGDKVVLSSKSTASCVACAGLAGVGYADSTLPPRSVLFVSPSGRGTGESEELTCSAELKPETEKEEEEASGRTHGLFEDANQAMGPGEDGRCKYKYKM